MGNIFLFFSHLLEAFLCSCGVILSKSHHSVIIFSWRQNIVAWFLNVWENFFQLTSLLLKLLHFCELLVNDFDWSYWLSACEHGSFVSHFLALFHNQHLLFLQNFKIGVNTRSLIFITSTLNGLIKNLIIDFKPIIALRIGPLWAINTSFPLGTLTFLNELLRSICILARKLFVGLCFLPFRPQLSHCWNSLRVPYVFQTVINVEVICI